MENFPLDYFVPFHFAEACGEGVGIDPLDRIEEFVKVLLLEVDHVPQDQYCEFLADDFEGAVHRARL